jgi:hypothetical protein
MSQVQHASFEVFADYHQFYVQDGDLNPPAPEDWTDDDVANRVKVAQNVVVVCPIRNMSVPVAIELYESKPDEAAEAWDHVVHCSLSIPTGHLQVHECTGGPMLDWHIKPGDYEVLILFGGLATTSDDGLNGQDHYKVLVWPGTLVPLTVARCWPTEAEA